MDKMSNDEVRTNIKGRKCASVILKRVVRTSYRHVIKAGNDRRMARVTNWSLRDLNGVGEVK